MANWLDVSPLHKELAIEIGRVRIYRLTADLIVRVLTASGWQEVLRVPRGRLTDLDSVPWWLRWLFPRGGPQERAAVVHDETYETVGIPRFFADAIFRLIMAEDGVVGWRRWVMWFVVRCLGWRHWNQSNLSRGGLRVFPPPGEAVSHD